MNNFHNYDTQKLKFNWVVFAGVCAFLTLTVTAMSALYGITGSKQSSRWESTFEVNKKISIIQTAQHWSKGRLYYGVNQRSGVLKTKYSIYWKKVGDPIYILRYDNGYCSSNKVYYGDWYMHSPNGYSKYTYKLVKRSNFSTKSVMVVDLMLL